MRVASCLYDEWQTDGWRDDKNMKIITNEENNDTIQIDLVKEPTKNQVDQGNSCH